MTLYVPYRHSTRGSGSSGANVFLGLAWVLTPLSSPWAPTGAVVQCQNDRSQHKNKATAMTMLKAKLYELELRKRQDAAQSLNDEKSDIGWGHQIRSYVLQPYQMVKDLRTGVETSQTGAVLDGDIDLFLEASLAAQLGDGTS